MSTFRPMLASPAGSLINWPMLASPKLDGVRCIVRGGVALSRSLRPIPNAHVQALFGRPELDGLDGELIVGAATAPDAFQRTQAGVMAAGGAPDVTFHVFDHADTPGGFAGRLNRAASLIAQAAAGQHVPRGAIKPLAHTHLRHADDLARYEAQALADGYEGVMLRDPRGPYKHGRASTASGWLLKVKRHADAEADIVGADALQRDGSPAPLLGALRAIDRLTGAAFAIGSGFTDRQRASLWRRRHTLPGQIARYRYQPHGTATAPRFPVFAGFRAAIDL